MPTRQNRLKIIIMTTLFLMVLLSFKVFSVQNLLDTHIGIVTASSLRCRTLADTKSSKVKGFSFGRILKYTKKTEAVKVGKWTAPWYYINKDNCWVFGTFLRFPNNNNIKKLNASFLTYPGGTEVDTNVPFYTIGNLYIQLHTIPFYGELIFKRRKVSKYVTIGLITRNNSELLFQPEMIAIYDDKGRWINKIKSTSKAKSMKTSLKATSLKKINEDGNEYYLKKKESLKLSEVKLQIKKLKKKDDKNTEVFFLYYTFEEMSIPMINKHISGNF